MKIFKNFFFQKVSLFFINYIFYKVYFYIFIFSRLLVHRVIIKNISISLKVYKVIFYAYQFLKIIYFLVKAPIISSKTRSLCYTFQLKTSLKIITKFYFWSYTSRSQSLKNTLLNQKHYYNKKKILLVYACSNKTSTITQWAVGVMWYHHFYFNKIYLILLTSRGAYKLQPLAWGLYLKTWFLDYWLYYLYSIQLPIGFYFYLKYFYLNYFYYSLYTNNVFYAQSSGTFLKVVFYNKLQSTLVIKLPSLKILTISNNGYIYIGRNSNIFIKKVVGGGYFSKLLSPKKISYGTRGISKNPVDHPNGGRTNVKSPFKTPWGKIAKNNK